MAMKLRSSKEPAKDQEVGTPDGSGKQDRPRERGAGCLVLFALPFAAVGLVMTTLLVVKLVQHREMQSWAVVPATILSAELERSAVPVLFEVPFDLPESAGGGSRKIEWKLQMDAAVPGVDYHAEFTVPVFRTAESDEGFVLDESPIEYLCLPGTLDEKLRRAGAKVQHLGDGLEIAFPMLLQRGAFFGMAFFTALWIGFTVLLAELGAPWYFPWVFGMFGGLLVLVLVSMIFSNKRLVLHSTELESSGGIFAQPRLPRHC